MMSQKSDVFQDSQVLLYMRGFPRNYIITFDDTFSRFTIRRKG